MGKKLQWIYLGIYTLTILYLVLSPVLKGETSKPGLDLLLSFVVFMLPAGIIAIELRGKKVFAVFTILAFLFVLVMFLGNLNFNALALDTILKAIVLGVMLVLLATYAFKRIFKKKSPKIS
jgi:hypothetical protein